jgi:hypothetical protein
LEFVRCLLGLLAGCWLEGLKATGCEGAISNIDFLQVEELVDLEDCLEIIEEAEWGELGLD